MIVTDPYKHIAQGMGVAFCVGQSKIVGSTTADIVAYESGRGFIEAWIGAEDKYGGEATHTAGEGTFLWSDGLRQRSLTMVGQLRFTIRRSLSTPTPRAATTAEAGRPPEQ